MLKSFSLALGLTLLVTGIFTNPTTVQAATRNWTGCPVTSYYGVDPGPRFSASWVVTGNNAVIAFQHTSIILGGGKGNLTLGELNRWKAMLDQLRTAAAKKVKVTVYYNDTNRVISTIIVHWNQGC